MMIMIMIMIMMMITIMIMIMIMMMMMMIMIIRRSTIMIITTDLATLIPRGCSVLACMNPSCTTTNQDTRC